jgi:calcineurin-like phosphoesterase family protein
MNIFFTADLHFGHKNICQYTNRNKFTTQEDHTEWLIDLHNSRVQDADTVYILGDVSFYKEKTTIEILSKLNGRLIVVRGNHDSRTQLKKFERDELIDSWYDYLELDHDGTKICMMHYPITCWNKQHHGSAMLHGHCVDLQTEILTNNGWKKRDSITIGDSIISYNIEKKCLENDTIHDIIDVDYSGKVIVGDSKSYDFRFTSEHTVLGKSSKNSKVFKLPARELLNRNSTILLTSGINQNLPGTGLSDDILKLWILITADGSIKKETNLCRIKVKKIHKKGYIQKVLTSAGIRFTRIDIDDYSSFNFYVPRELNDFNLKGLDDKILTATEIEASSIFEAYSNSDGHLPRESNTLIIYSAKENEIDLLQAMFSQNGYHTNKFSRHHGFGNKLQHQLSVTKKNQVLASTKFIKTEDVTNEQFWCVKGEDGQGGRYLAHGTLRMV